MLSPSRVQHPLGLVVINICGSDQPDLSHFSLESRSSNCWDLLGYCKSIHINLSLQFSRFIERIRVFFKVMLDILRQVPCTEHFVGICFRSGHHIRRLWRVAGGFHWWTEIKRRWPDWAIMVGKLDTSNALERRTWSMLQAADNSRTARRRAKQRSFSPPVTVETK